MSLSAIVDSSMLEGSELTVGLMWGKAKATVGSVQLESCFWGQSAFQHMLDLGISLLTSLFPFGLGKVVTDLGKSDWCSSIVCYLVSANSKTFSFSKHGYTVRRNSYE